MIQICDKLEGFTRGYDTNIMASYNYLRDRLTTKHPAMTAPAKT